jgi:competence protein ComEC
MADAWAVALAVAAVLGVLARLPVLGQMPAPVPMVMAVGAAVLATGLFARRPAVLCVGVFLLAGALSTTAWAGLTPPPAGPYDAVVTLITDPAPAGSGVAAVARGPTGRVELVAYGPASAPLAARAAGELVHVGGRIGPVPPRARSSLVPKHVRARVSVAWVADHWPGAPVARSANRVRNAIDRGVRTMSPTERSLFLGFVIGDDRGQPPSLVTAFRDSGLAHLSAVSGENVAFLLAVVQPVLRRFGIRVRWAATLGVIAWFAVLTRFEPSVLRAAVMAGLAATAAFTNRPASGVRLLTLTVAGLVLIDPLLVYSVGFWLSVAATAGLVMLSVPLADHLPGPHWLTQPLAVTLAAQVGVAPVAIAVFGGVPVAALPANILAAPAAGPVMVLGLPLALAAAAVPDPAAVLLVLPLRALVRWIALVALVCARLPLGTVGPATAALTAAVIGAVLVIAALRRRSASARPPPFARPPDGDGRSG